MALPVSHPLGRSGLSVSGIGMGTAALALPYGPPGAEREAPERAEAVAAIVDALDAGITLIDTAPTYGDAEAIVGDAIRDRPEAVVATKVTIPARARHARVLRPAIQHSVEESLARLGRSHIDVLQVHNATAATVGTPALLRELAALRDQGLVTVVGATVYDEASALAVIESDDFECIQVPYNALDRRPEQRVFARAAARKCSVLVRSVLMHGLLSSAVRSLPSRWRPVREAVDAFRRAMGASWDELPAAALAFASTAPGVACAITGPRDGRELRRLLLSAEDFAERAGAVRAQPGPDLDAQFLDPRLWPTSGTAIRL
jgi:aryl-alcohol dehydrogenase-like predicted oxidoreductase